LRQAQKEGLIKSDYLGLQIEEAEKAQIISKAEARALGSYHEKVASLLAVDDFATEDLVRAPVKTVTPKKAPGGKTAKKKAAKKTAPRPKRAASRKKPASKKKSTKA